MPDRLTVWRVWRRVRQGSDASAGASCDPGRADGRTGDGRTHANRYISCSVDATHPYAVEVTEHIKESAKKTNLPYLRLSRSTAAEREIAEHEWMIHTVADTQECVELLSKLPGNILLTTGSKELHAYAAREEIRERLFVRVLPGVESIEICHREQIPGKQIIAMQGPFGTELNEALIRQYDIGVLVTKESGQAGGFPEKIRAAEHTKIPVVMIQNPEQAGGMSMEKVLSEIETLCGKKERDEASAAADFSCGNRDGEHKVVHRRGKGGDWAGEGGLRSEAAACRGGYPDRAGCRETGGVPSRRSSSVYFIPAGKKNRADCHLIFR